MFRFASWASLMLVTAQATFAWNASGHRLITFLALDGMPDGAPSWLQDETTRSRIAFQSSEPDRWRSTNVLALHHINKPDHFLDIEDLARFGLTLETIPPLRNEYMRACAISKHVHPEQAGEYDSSKDADRTKEFPGLLPHAIVENYAKLQSAFQQIRILERVNDPTRAFQLQQCRENAIYTMGVLSHFVGDAAQPLHTTCHYNGWVGENPGGYTTSNRFHSLIDGGAKHPWTVESIKPQAKLEVKVNARDPWQDVIAYIQRSHQRMERLYQLEKSGDLAKDPGRELIAACYADGAAMLSALYRTAWESSAPNEKQVAEFVTFDEQKPSAAAPASQPAASRPATP